MARFNFRLRGYVPIIPVNTVAPSFPASPKVGAAIVADIGVWANEPTDYAFQHQWSDDGATGWTDISGATAQSYTPSEGVQGKYVRPGVLASNLAGASGFAHGAAVGPVGLPYASAVSFGKNTRSGFGGVDVLGSATISSGIGASDWTKDAAGLLVPSGSYGAVKAFSRDDYELTLSDTRVITIAMVDNASHVRSTATDSGSSNQLNTLISTENGAAGSLRLGDTVFLRDCHFNPTGASWSVRVRTAYTQGPGAGNRITIRSETVDTSVDAGGNKMNRHGGKIGALAFFTDTSLDIAIPYDFKWIHFYRDAGGSTPMFDFTQDYGYGVGFYECGVEGGPSITSNYPPGLSLNRQHVVDHCTFHRLGKSLTTEGGGNTITWNYGREMYDDFISIAGGGNTVEDNFGVDWRWQFSNHPDFIQFRPTSTYGNYGLGSVKRNIVIRGIGTDGYIDAQGVFARNSFETDFYTGGVTAQNNIICITMQNGLYFQTLTNPNISWNTGLADFEKHPVLTRDPPPASPDCQLKIPTETGRNGTGGQIDRNLFNAYDLSGQSSIASQVYNLSVAKNLTAYDAALDAYTNDPAVLISRAAAIAAFTPLLNGTAKNADGTYSGALFPDGSWNDGAAYVEGRLPAAA